MQVEKSKIAFVTNIPSPYRVFYFDTLASILGERLLVIYCAKNEPNRAWKVPELSHNAIFLPQKSTNLFGKSLYFQSEVFSELKRYGPDLVITGGFNPTILLSVVYCWTRKIKHAINTDAWELNERSYKWYHKFLRKLVYKRSAYFFPISNKGRLNLVENYGVNDAQICVIPYVINQVPFKKRNVVKKYDVLFSGQFIDRKMPLFFAQVCNLLAQQFHEKLRVAVLGNGPLQTEFLAALEHENIELYYPGFVQQEEIPELFCRSKYFLFPTLEDGWGVVANEAVAAGIPCITCDNAGAAGDIIRHNENGLVLELKENTWVREILRLEEDPKRYSNMEIVNKGFSDLFSADVIANRFLGFIDEK